ncbi:hypothetical protein B0T09DRAFT_330915 [Sordaria sp. MPI-SDFR-AT-0083]|nr:hypothetical protein B0T09DRAFT_330915 [Sordaria sp. MPI-SDFR-AT-0083]
MQSLHGTTWPRHFAFWALATLHLKSTVRAECAPTTWDNSEFETTGHCSVPNPLAATSAAVPIPVPTSHLISTGYVTPGEVNCRYDTNTEDMEINEHTCTAIAVRYGITLKAFFVLNPGLHSDCGNIEANTDYCVAGCKITRELIRQRGLFETIYW